MAVSLYVDAFALFKIWALGVFGLHLSGFVHILLVFAVFVFMVRLLSRKVLIRKPGS